MPERGCFVSIEGGEGAGKSTQARLLHAALHAAGHRAVLTREPGGTPGAEALRRLLLGGDIAWSLAAETLLHFAARADHVEQLIRPALARGEWVVSDRFYDSTMVYQGYGQGADRARIAALSAQLGLSPDLTIVLDVPVEVSLDRLAHRAEAADRYERLGAAFFGRVREGFLAVAGDQPQRCVLVRAEAAPEVTAGGDLVGCPPPPAGRGVSLPEPRANPDLLGHASAEAVLLDAMRSGRLHHAWLLLGQRGIGKATLAFRFARRLLAGPPPSDEGLALPPDHPVFRRVAAGSHADLLTVERSWDEKRKKLRGEIVVDDVRRTSVFLRRTPAEGGWRIVVVDGAEDLNRNAANALLKVLEEPPPRALLLLVCAAAGSLPPTIRSRCLRLRMGPLAEADVTTLLHSAVLGRSAGELARLAALSEGSVGRALQLAEGDGVAVAELVGRALAEPVRLTVQDALATADALGREDDAFATFVDLARASVAAAVRAAARNASDAAQRQMLGRRALADWVAVWQALGTLKDQTEGLHLDKREALVQGFDLLARGADTLAG